LKHPYRKTQWPSFGKDRGVVGVIGPLSCVLLTLQNSQDRNYCVPVPLRRWHAVQLVDLAKIADCLHVAPVHSKHELALRSHHPHQPLRIRGERDWKRRPDAARFRQNAHEPNKISGARLRSNGFSTSKRIRSRPSHSTTCASNGSLRSNAARKFARDPGLRTTKVPAAPRFTTS
jgi:hypothetical protein